MIIHHVIEFETGFYLGVAIFLLGVGYMIGEYNRRK